MTGMSEERSLWKRAADAIGKNKKLEYAVYGGLILLAIALYALSLVSGRRDRETPAAQESQRAVTAPDTETRLKKVLSCIRGAGRVEVMITYETGGELVTAMSKNVNSNASETTDGEKTSSNTQTTEVSEPATVGGSGGNEPIILMEREPVARGVIVVAEGAADVRVKLDLQRAVQAVLNIPLTSIEVFEFSMEPEE